MKILLAIILSLAGFAPAFADIVFDEAQGKTVQFAVDHDGTGTFTYQWKKDGQPIAGATSKSFTLPNIKAGDAGVYTCQVTNKAGTVLSDKGVFSVTVNPTTATITIKTLAQ